MEYSIGKFSKLTNLGIHTLQLYGDILQLYEEMQQAGKEKAYKKAESKETPEFTDKDGKMVYSDICYPVTKEFREEMNTVVMENYQKEKRKIAEQEQKKLMQNSRKREIIKDTPFR